MRHRSLRRLMDMQCYAYQRWIDSHSEFWYKLAVACTKSVKDHREYRGVR